MNEKSFLNALTSSLILAAGASLPLHAQIAHSPIRELWAELSPSRKSGGRSL